MPPEEATGLCLHFPRRYGVTFYFGAPMRLGLGLGLSHRRPQAGGGGVPEWVPEGYSIWIEPRVFDEFPNGRAWVSGTGIVDVDTLLGSDENTGSAYGSTSYDPEKLSADGYVGAGTPFAFVGSALTQLLAGATIRFKFTIPTESQGSLDFYVTDANIGANAVYFEVKAGANKIDSGSYGGSASFQQNGVVNSGTPGGANISAVTVSPTRGEMAINGNVAQSEVFDTSDWPTGQLVAALVNINGTGGASLESIGFLEAILPSTDGLSDLTQA